jgi:AcrR family transcriptional regulator
MMKNHAATVAPQAKTPDRIPVGDPSAARQRILQVAEKLFYLEGFHAVGLDRILREVGISKQAFYKHFSTKEDLVVEVIRWHDRWWRDHCRAYLQKEAGDDPRRQLYALLKLFVDVLGDSDFRGCYFVNAITQFPNPMDPIYQAALAAKDAIDVMVRDLALCAGASDPIRMSNELSLIFEGAFAMRALRKSELVKPTLRRLAEDLLDRYLQDPKSK